VSGLLADLARLICHPRQWWREATCSPCPRCGEQVDVARWFEHKAGHQGE